MVFVANGSYVTRLVFAVPSIHLLNTTYPIPGEGSFVKAMDVYVNGKIVFWIDSANKVGAQSVSYWGGGLLHASLRLVCHFCYTFYWKICLVYDSLQCRSP